VIIDDAGSEMLWSGIGGSPGTHALLSSPNLPPMFEACSFYGFYSLQRVCPHETAPVIYMLNVTHQPDLVNRGCLNPLTQALVAQLTLGHIMRLNEPTAH
jgi:hypothetical protein